MSPTCERRWFRYLGHAASIGWGLRGFNQVIPGPRGSIWLLVMQRLERPSAGLSDPDSADQFAASLLALLLQARRGCGRLTSGA
jgi:hypothetical protein